MSYLLFYELEFQALDTLFANQNQSFVIGLQDLCDTGPIGLGVQGKAVALIAADQERAGQADQDDTTIVQSNAVIECGLGSGVNRQPGVAGILLTEQVTA